MWVRELQHTEQDDEYDSEADEEYVPPPALCLDSSLDYDEYSSGEDLIPEEEVTCLIEESSAPLKPPGYMEFWVNVGSVQERIERAKEELLLAVKEPVEGETVDETLKEKSEVDVEL